MPHNAITASQDRGRVFALGILVTFAAFVLIVGVLLSFGLYVYFDTQHVNDGPVGNTQAPSALSGQPSERPDADLETGTGTSNISRTPTNRTPDSREDIDHRPAERSSSPKADHQATLNKDDLALSPKENQAPSRQDNSPPPPKEEPAKTKPQDTSNLKPDDAPKEGPAADESPKPILPPTGKETKGPGGSALPINNRLPNDVVVIKRQSETTDEELRKQLLLAPETGFNQLQAAILYKSLNEGLAQRQAGTSLPVNLASDLGPAQFRLLTVKVNRPEQFGLPWRGEPDCSLGKEAAERLQVLSQRLRDGLRKAAPQDDVRPDPDKLSQLLADQKGEEWRSSAAVPALVQLLQVENTPIRLLLVNLLAEIDGKEASAALVQRALFDLSPEVREKAVQALAKRPARQYQELLVQGLRYPWSPAAVHASEAITALRLNQVTPDLVNMLKEPEPSLPVKKNENEYTRTELVRINHLSNCVMCHAPSQAKEDLIRGRIPIPGEDPPPLYYNATSGLFARANTTFLRQDFSVVQPVTDNGKWPANQRYDYLVRTRKLNSNEVSQFRQLEAGGKLPKSYPQRDAVLTALRQLTNVDAGDSYEEWAKKVKDLPDKADPKK
jgi:cell division protein FtsN